MTTPNLATILMVDDDPPLLRATQINLERAGIGPVDTMADSRMVMSRLAQHQPQIMLLDLSMPHINGMELLPIIHKRYPNIAIIIMTATMDLHTAVDCMKMGAVDFLTKPVERASLVSRVLKTMEIQGLHGRLTEMSNRLLSGRVDQEEVFAPIITKSSKMIRIFQYLESIATSNEPVLITGETGVGKELVAQALHRLTLKDQPFIAENVAGIDDTIFADTLFGHVQGAFTGATHPRPGLVERAEHGTLLLDEIGDLSPSSQIKLLRLIQERTYSPLGSDHNKPLQARILVTTHQNLAELVSLGKFRQDLYYRLTTHKVTMPPLRERREDIYPLLLHFIRQAATAMNKKIPPPPESITDMLNNHPFSGNIRELRSMTMDAASQYKGSGPLPLTPFHTAMRTRLLPIEIQPLSQPTPPTLHLELPITTPLPTLKEGFKIMETFLIEQALQRSQGNRSRAASLLGLSRQALYNRTLFNRK